MDRMDFAFMESDDMLPPQSPVSGDCMMCIDSDSMDFVHVQDHSHFNHCPLVAPSQPDLQVDEVTTDHQYNPNEPPPSSKPMVSWHDESKGVFGCKHYARNCFLKADCCDQWYVCRLCHDESNEAMDSIMGGGNQNGFGQNNLNNKRMVKPHKINRYSTKLAKCMRCGTEQEASQFCINPNCSSDDNTSSDEEVGDQKYCQNEDGNCSSNSECNSNSNCNEIGSMHSLNQLSAKRRQNTQYALAKYYCDICKFYDDAESKEIFHCPDCGLCRLGKVEDYIHCKRCGCCLNHKYYAKHPCIEDSLKSDCPICFTYLFKSREPVTFFMPCGHPIHYDCLVQYGKVSSLCPICRTKWYDEESERRQTIADAIKLNLPDLNGNGDGGGGDMDQSGDRNEDEQNDRVDRISSMIFRFNDE